MLDDENKYVEIFDKAKLTHYLSGSLKHLFKMSKINKEDLTNIVETKVDEVLKHIATVPPIASYVEDKTRVGADRTFPGIDAVIKTMINRGFLSSGGLLNPLSDNVDGAFMHAKGLSYLFNYVTIYEPVDSLNEGILFYLKANADALLLEAKERGQDGTALIAKFKDGTVLVWDLNENAHKAAVFNDPSVKTLKIALNRKYAEEFTVPFLGTIN
jgi:hypothetical protein